MPNMTANNPKYLIKFVSNKKYADTFLNGILYMNAAGYYHNIERGRGDIKEASVMSRPFDIPNPYFNVSMFKCAEYPIFCMYAVFEDDIEYNTIKNINRKCIDDFSTGLGYAVVITYDNMLSVISSCKINGADIVYKSVEYRDLTDDDEYKFITTTTIDNLFVKNPYFQYQNEFRIVVCEKVKTDIEWNDKDGATRTYLPAQYKFSFDIRNKAKIYCLNDIEQDSNGNYFFHIS